ncbi:MAG TPA: serine hydrolase [Gemmatimonas sp.]|nr:serine hydrolase [Gemmatimonas sp.]
MRADIDTNIARQQDEVFEPRPFSSARRRANSSGFHRPQVQAAPAYEARVRELVGILQGSGDYAAFFTSGFQTAVPRERLAPINVQLTAAHGAPVAVDGTTLQTPYAGTVRIRYERATVAFQLIVDPAAPHQVSGLRVLGPIAAEKSLGEVTAALDGLHGATAYAFAKLGAGAPEVITQHNPGKALAVGSAFKLVILAELVRATNAGERRWDDSVTLDGGVLPGGGYTGKPKGTKVSLRELATQMISISDNSATDILLFALGREKVEAMLPAIGVKHPVPRDARDVQAQMAGERQAW